MFGVGDTFDEVWSENGERVPGHLALLGLRDCVREIEVVRRCVDRPDAGSTIERMLAEANWRPNLVAATAVVFLPRDGRLAGALWRALDEASWVSPQLAVVSSFHDPAFVRAAHARARDGCPIEGARWGASRHGQPNAKALSALCALLDEIAPAEVASVRADPRIAALLASEAADGGDVIARGWRRSAMEILRSA